MKRILPTVGNIFFTLFVAAIIGFLVSLSWSAMSRVFPESLVNQLFGLANFDIAAAAWLLCFIYVARGEAQRGLALVMFGISMIGVVAVVALEVGISTGVIDVAAVMRPLSIVLTVLTVAHVSAAYWFHLNDMDTQRLIEKQADVDQTIQQAQKDAQQAMNTMRPDLAQKLARMYVDDALRELGLWNAAPLVVDGKLSDLPSPAVGQEAAQPAQAQRPGPASSPKKKIRWPWKLPQFPDGGHAGATTVTVPVCLWCSTPLKDGQVLYCSSLHELAHLERIEVENRQRMQSLRADVAGAAYKPEESFRDEQAAAVAGAWEPTPKA